MPATKFGPEVNAGKNASYWERYLRHLVSTLLIFDERRKAYINKPNLAWLQLYAYICAKTGCLHSAKLPGATALKALLDGHDNPDTANAGILKIIKRYKAEADEGTNIGRKFLKLELGAIICIQNVKKIDAPLIQ